MLTIYLTIVVVPLVILLSLALQKHPSLFHYVTSALAMGLAVLFMWVILPWDVVSIYYRWAIPVLYVAALVLAYRGIGKAAKQPGRWAKFFLFAINLVLILFFGALSLGALIGYPAPGNAIALSSPLQNGHFVVGQGGASPLINGHFRVTPQNFALDIIGVNGWGARVKGFGSSNQLTDYAIYGAAIVAPCSGTVLTVVDDLPDQAIGSTDRENLAGNHVVLSCHDSEIVLAHMQPGSVAVTESQQVNVGDLLGKVGNSGNTSEPHLHIHAERGGEAGEILNGEGVPLLIDGRFLVRGDLLD